MTVDIGPEEKPFTAEPAEDPFRHRRPAPAPEPAPLPVPAPEGPVESRD
jgi:hypothetical protein